MKKSWLSIIIIIVILGLPAQAIGASKASDPNEACLSIISRDTKSRRQGTMQKPKRKISTEKKDLTAYKMAHEELMCEFRDRASKRPWGQSLFDDKVSDLNHRFSELDDKFKLSRGSDHLLQHTYTHDEIVYLGNPESAVLEIYKSAGRIVGYMLRSINDDGSESSQSRLVLFEENGSCRVQEVAHINRDNLVTIKTTASLCAKLAALKEYFDLQGLCKKQGGQSAPGENPRNCICHDKRKINVETETCDPERQASAHKRWIALTTGYGGQVDYDQTSYRTVVDLCKRYGLTGL